nr:facilitated trehalose transporter Tret1-like [Danaus plexippus plexippus]
MCSVSDGLIFGQMSGMIDALRQEDRDVPLTEDDISFIASIINIMCICGYAVVGVISEYLGRRKAITLISLPVCLTWILVYLAHDKVTLIFTRIILGISFGGILWVVYISVGEYKSPDVRVLYLNLISSVGTLVGVTTGHLLCIILHWRQVALIAIIPTALSAFLPLFWVESPVWLATKGRFEECEEAFWKLHVFSDSSENELRLLISYERQKQSERRSNPSRHFFGKKFLLTMNTKYFWKISAIASIVCICRVASGRVLFSTLAITMLHDITGTSDIFLFTLVLDGFVIIGSLLSWYFLNKFKIRQLFFTSGMVANVCLVTFSLCLYFYPGSDYYLSWIKISLLALYFVIQAAGTYPVLEGLLAEIFPVDLKTYFVVIIGLLAGTSQFLSVKLTPYIISRIGYHGLFLLNGGIIFFCMAYLWFSLPETKGRSLHEIEYYFKNNTFNYNEEFESTEKSSKLLVDNSCVEK